jgi:hypothetical protein
VDFASSVGTALDPVLVPLGFAPGQCGEDQAIFCAAYDVLGDRFPGLPQSGAQQRGAGCCIDLVVDRAHPGLDVHLEGPSLSATLRALGLDDEAAAVDGLSGAPLDEALQTLTDVLPRLFRAAGD